MIIEVSAAIDDPDWGIVQLPFMQKNARTIEFRHKIIVGHRKMRYKETTVVDIYGKVFDHTDECDLELV